MIMIICFGLLGLYVCTSVDPNNVKMYLLFPVASEETTAAPGEETTAAPPGKNSNALFAKPFGEILISFKNGVREYYCPKFCASDIFSILYKPFITMYFLGRHHRVSSRPIHGLGIVLSSYYWTGTFFLYGANYIPG